MMRGGQGGRSIERGALAAGRFGLRISACGIVQSNPQSKIRNRKKPAAFT
jgi:hypothetical protein